MLRKWNFEKDAKMDSKNFQLEAKGFCNLSDLLSICMNLMKISLTFDVCLVNIAKTSVKSYTGLCLTNYN